MVYKVIVILLAMIYAIYQAVTQLYKKEYGIICVCIISFILLVASMIYEIKRKKSKVMISPKLFYRIIKIISVISTIIILIIGYLVIRK